MDPGVKQHQSLLLIEQSLLHVELLKDVDVECEVAAEGQTLLDKVLHGEFRNLERNQNRPPARVLIHTATWGTANKLEVTKLNYNITFITKTKITWSQCWWLKCSRDTYSQCLGKATIGEVGQYAGLSGASHMAYRGQASAGSSE